MEQIARDIRFALRRLTRRPLFTLVAIASLALGIGANSAIFTLVNAVVWRDAGFSQPETLVEVYRSVAGFSHATFSYPDYQDFKRDAAEVFEDVAASRLALVPIDMDGSVEVVPAELVTGNWFELLGVPAERGRLFQASDDLSPGGHPLVVLSHSFWRQRFAEDPEAIGSSMTLGGRDYTIIGVAPASYTGNLRGLTPSFFTPMAMVDHLQPSGSSQLESRGNQSLFLKGRLHEGVGLTQAQGLSDRLAEGFKSDYPGQWQAANEIILVPTTDVIVNPMIDRFVRAGALLMLGVVGLVLLIACANLASFLLAQAADRRKEIAVRLALGAKRRQLVRQLLTESLLLSLVGGALGVGVAVAALGALQAADIPLPFPVTLDLRPDASVLLFTLTVSLVAGVLFGLAPALQGTNPDVAPTLKDEGAGGGRPKAFNLRNGLVVLQVAMSMVLLVGSGLFLKSLQARIAVDPGFGYDPAAVLTLQMPPSQYEAEEGRVFLDTYLARVAELPGVGAVGHTDDLHLSSLNNSSMGVQIDGVEPPPGQDYHLVERAIVDSGFFEAVGVRILQGRNFEDTDVEDAPRVVIVSEAMAERFWPDGDAVGRVLRNNNSERTVVGVASDAKVRSLGESPRPFIYLPFSAHYNSNATVVATTTGSPERLAIDMADLLRSLDPEVVVYEQKTMARHLEVMVVGHRLAAMIITAFGALALLLALIGLYGVVSYAVSTRKREMGIRMALGANNRDVVALLTKGGLRLVLVGLAVGAFLAWAAARLLSGLLYGVEATDPVAYVGVALVLLLVGVLASYLPARRAGALDPVTSLKTS